MAAAYTEIPHNWNEVEDFVEADSKKITSIIITADKLFFYDTCSFIRHANMSEERIKFFLHYFKNQAGHIIVTRCILMELASCSGNLNEEYVRYFRTLDSAGLKVLLLKEENLFDVLSECFSTNLKVNEYLSWAVRMMNSPISTIADTLKSDAKLYEELVKGKNLSRSDLYRRFFTSVRGHKEASDNLGEELIGICLHILSYLPGMKDGKLCIVTDDKGAAGKIDSLIKRTNNQYRGAKIIIYSTPKLAQHMYQEHLGLGREDLVEILSQGTNKNVVVMGTTVYDLAVNDKISMTGEELAQKIIEPNGIHIVF